MKQLLLSKLPALFAALAAEQKLYIPADDAAGQANFTLWREGLQLTKKLNTVRSAKDLFFPQVKEVYDMEKLKPTQTVMMQLYPEIYACVGCNACTKACTQGLNVMQYIAYAQRGEFDKCAEESFDCVMCGVCSSRCPAGISHPQVAMLARRLNGKYIAPHCEHLDARVQEVKDGKFEALIESLMEKPLDAIKELYNHREIEK